jgi:hypothetical protein
MAHKRHKSSDGQVTAQPRKTAKAAEAVTIEKIFTEAERLKGESPEAYAHLQEILTRVFWNCLEKSDSWTETNDRGISGGAWDSPPLLVGPLVHSTPKGASLAAHDLLAKTYVVAKARSTESFDRTYAVWLGSGMDCVVRFVYDCDNHAIAKTRAMVYASSLQWQMLADVLVIGPWRGDPKIAPPGTLVAACSPENLFEVEDPYAV